MRLSEFAPAVAAQVMAEMRAEAQAVVGKVARGALEETRRAYMRYMGQGFEIAVEVAEPCSAEALREAFDAAYQALYGRLIPGLEVEVLSWTLTLRAPPPELALASASAPPRRRLVDERWMEREALAPGTRVLGPSVIVEDQTVTVVPCGATAQVDAMGNIVVENAA